ncbi:MULTISPECIES: LlaJI family restriction endonuclease [Bacillus cereus group]|uniref:LlaJI family restriction endonuclease n=1 Tax=Bacillus cereus group TaxID=86661 RepID=UPI00099553E5|nr:LlaJI family restriction endonuclease [Bacillus cereus]OOZ90803.1 hypothetical protein BHL25_03375 [Bacillus cereus]HDR7827543.1 LlaJI family restriction endonuclease [Bacillus anthracis]HDR8026305.1 LlaJI family restriction endonuclease [Bacillus cereus]
MNPIFLEENKRYSLANFSEKFNERELDVFIQECSKRGIVKSHRGYEKKVSFEYVGIIIFDKRLVVCLPKYSSEEAGLDDKIALMKQIMEVLKIYSSESIQEDELEFLGDSNDESVFNLLAAVDFFINDYVENGLYKNEKIEYVFDGSGEVDWQQTMDNHLPYVTKNQTPVYLELITQEVSYEGKHIIVGIHKKILNECCEYLSVTGLGEFLDYPNISFSLDLYELGNQEFQLNMIKKALYEDYNDRNLVLLRQLYNYLTRGKSLISNEGIVFWGTRSFHTVWEKCCANILGHQEEIKKFIPNPVWTNFDIKDTSKKTLIPDITKKYVQDEKNLLFIIDSKYYDIAFGAEKVIKNPGIEDVIKQYMYESSLHNYIKEKNIDEWYNVFVFPTCAEGIEKIGEVSIEFLKDLKNVLLVKLPAKDIYNRYIQRQKWESKEWNGFIEELNK